MKIKQDFVTNSSSTSFIAWGITIEEGEYPDGFLERVYELYKKVCEDKSYRDDYTSSFEEFKEEEDLQYLIYEALGEEMQTYYQYEEGILYLGVCPFTMKEEQTLKEFKEEICAKFLNAGIVVLPKDLNALEYCGMDT